MQADFLLNYLPYVTFENDMIMPAYHLVTAYQA